MCSVNDEDDITMMMMIMIMITMTIIIPTLNDNDDDDDNNSDNDDDNDSDNNDTTVMWTLEKSLIQTCYASRSNISIPHTWVRPLSMTHNVTETWFTPITADVQVCGAQKGWE